MVKDGLRFFRLKMFLVILFSLISLFGFNSYAGINDDLWQALKEGNTSRVAELISSGADVNAKDKGGWTALIWLAFRGHTGIVKLLIDKGAEVNAKTNYGETALIMAAFRGHTETMKLLIDKGADVNAKFGEDGWTALMLATKYGYSDIIQLLKQAGARE